MPATLDDLSLLDHQDHVGTHLERAKERLKVVVPVTLVLVVMKHLAYLSRPKRSSILYP